MARNEVTLQSEEGLHPVDENLRPIKVGGKTTSLEIAQDDNGARINGDLEVTGSLGRVKAKYIESPEDSSSIITLSTNNVLIDAQTITFGETVSDGGAIFDPNVNYFYFLNSSDTSDKFVILVDTNGASTLSTIDNDGAVGHLTLDADGDIILDAHTGITKFYDAGDTDDAFKITVVGGTGATTLETVSVSADGHLTLDADGFLKLDAHAYAAGEGVQFYLAGTKVGDITGHHNATNFVLYENIGASTDDFFYIGTAASGYTIIGTTDVGGAAGHIQFAADGHIVFDTCPVGFNKLAEAFSDDSIIGSGGTDDTHIDFRVTNKISLAVTGNITNLNLIFPAVSGNFLLLLTYDGDHTITNYKVYEADESAADGDADVFWPGGTKPDNTASGVDILSFFYDATAGADKCYGVASLAFATP